MPLVRLNTHTHTCTEEQVKKKSVCMGEVVGGSAVGAGIIRDKAACPQVFVFGGFFGGWVLFFIRLNRGSE